jgi:chaperonin GroES
LPGFFVFKEKIMSEQISLHPTGHHVVVKVEEASEKTSGGLYVPIQAREKRMNEGNIGILIAAGPQAWEAFADGEPWAKVGDRVLCIKHAGVALDKTPNIRLMNDEDILAVIGNEQEV